MSRYQQVLQLIPQSFYSVFAVYRYDVDVAIGLQKKTWINGSQAGQETKTHNIVDLVTPPDIFSFDIKEGQLGKSGQSIEVINWLLDVRDTTKTHSMTRS